jgi:hypothetical protein
VALLCSYLPPDINYDLVYLLFYGYGWFISLVICVSLFAVMAHQDHVSYVEDLIQYKFHNREWATIALTAAGAEEFNHDGNRMCARYGRVLIEFYVLNNCHSAGVSPCT